MAVAEKTCTKCQVVKPAADFYKEKRVHSGLKSECKACANANGAANTAAYRARHPERAKRYATATHLKKRYGISISEYEEMHLVAQGRCAICRQEAPLVVDHCHTTGKVRGLICQPCNVGLGGFRDDMIALSRAIHYLLGTIKEAKGGRQS